MEEEITREVTDKGEVKSVRLDFRLPADTRSPYANELIIQTIHTEFILSFFELKIPLPTGIEEEATPNVLRADCVSRVVVSAEKIPEIIEALKTQYNLFVEHRKALRDDSVKDVKNVKKK